MLKLTRLGQGNKDGYIEVRANRDRLWPAGSPRIDDRGTVYFSDATHGGVYRVAPGRKPPTLISKEARKAVGGIALTEDRGLVVTGPSVALWYEGGQTTDILKTYPGKLTKTFNDLAVDQLGSIFVGSVNGLDTVTNGIPDTDPAT
jgi:sugar lactone lactonase YvrE